MKFCALFPDRQSFYQIIVHGCFVFLFQILLTVITTFQWKIIAQTYCQVEVQIKEPFKPCFSEGVYLSVNVNFKLKSLTFLDHHKTTFSRFSLLCLQLTDELCLERRIYTYYCAHGCAVLQVSITHNIVAVVKPRR